MYRCVGTFFIFSHQSNRKIRKERHKKIFTRKKENQSMTTPTLIEDLNHKMEQQIELRRKEIASLGMKIAKSMNKLFIFYFCART